MAETSSATYEAQTTATPTALEATDSTPEVMETLEATLSAAPEPPSTAATESPPQFATPPLEATGVPSVETPARAAMAAGPDRTSCSEIAGGDYRSPMERAWYLDNCKTPARSTTAVARAVSTPARPAPTPVANLYRVSAGVCASGVLQYPSFSEKGIVYGSCAVATSSNLPAGGGICATAYVLIPSASHANALYCYRVPSGSSR